MGIGGDRLGRGRARGKKRNSRGMRFLDVDWIYAIRESRGRWRFCRHGFVRDVDGIGFFFVFVLSCPLFLLRKDPRSRSANR